MRMSRKLNVLILVGTALLSGIAGWMGCHYFTQQCVFHGVLIHRGQLVALGHKRAAELVQTVGTDPQLEEAQGRTAVLRLYPSMDVVHVRERGGGMVIRMGMREYRLTVDSIGPDFAVFSLRTEGADCCE
jgi:hypothetical protein